MDELPYMASFVQVVEAGSFAAAARQLGTSVSAVSKQVAKLEKVLGTRLLNRTTRNVSPTEAGSIYYERCVRIIGSLEEARDALPSHKGLPRGHLRVTAPVVFTNLFIVPRLPEFHARYPDISLHIHPTDTRLDLAEDGYDLGIRITATPPPNMVGRKLGSNYRLLCCASPAYLKKHGTPKRPADLATHQCLMFMTTMNEWAFTRDGAGHPVKVDGRIQVNNTEAMLKLTLLDMGVVILPEFMVTPHLASGELVQLFPEYGLMPALDIYAIYLPHRYIPAKLRAFVEFLGEKLQELD